MTSVTIQQISGGLKSRLSHDDTFEIQEAGGGSSKYSRISDILPVFYPVRHRGAMGDDSTDDTAAILSAIAAAEASGGEVLISPGAYRVSAEIFVNVGGISIYLDKGAVLKAMNQITGGIIAIRASNVHLRGPGKIDGNGQPGTYGVYAFGVIGNIHISGIEVTGTTNDAVLCKGTDNSNRIYDCTIKYVHVHDVWEGIMFWYADDCEMFNCRSLDMNVDAAQDCFELSDCSRCSISNCVARNPGPNNACFDIFGECVDCDLENSRGFQTIAIANTWGIIVTSLGSGGSRVNITDCRIVGKVTTTQGATGSGVGIDTKSFNYGLMISKGTDVKVKGCLIVGCCNTTSANGIIISNNVTSFSVDDCTIVQTGGAAMYVICQASMSLKITNNTLRNSHWDTNATARAVLDIQGVQPAECVLVDNRFQNDQANLKAFYYIEGMSGTLTGAIIKGNQGDGGLAVGGSNNPIWIETSGNYYADNNFKDQGRVGTVQSYSQNAGTTGFCNSSTKTVNHGLHRVTPLVGQISIMMISPGSGAVPIIWYVDTITLTQFTIHFLDSAGSPVSPTNAEFGWRVDTTTG